MYLGTLPYEKKRIKATFYSTFHKENPSASTNVLLSYFKFDETSNLF